MFIKLLVLHEPFSPSCTPQDTENFDKFKKRKSSSYYDHGIRPEGFLSGSLIMTLGRSDCSVTKIALFG